MPTTYIKSISPNTSIYLTKHLGVRTYSTNRRYIHKKPRGEVLVGVDLSWEDCETIHKLFNLGCKKKVICERYNLSKYYLNKVLSMCLH